MSGNVWEWVWDWYAEYTAAPQDNPQGPAEGCYKVIRGGAWASPAEGVRTTYRVEGGGDIRAVTRHPNIGFRCVVPEMQENEVEIHGEAVSIPPGNVPEIDGSIDPDEWYGAMVENFADGSELFLMQTGDTMYLGIRASDPKMIAGNVYIHQDGQIQILHASAALGTAIYQQDGQTWRQIRNFSWRCRSTGNTESAQAERAEFLAEEGWLAANGRMGTPNELEYQIVLPGQNVEIAVVYIKATYPYEKIPWPANLDDDSVQPSTGELPEEMYFSPSQWVVLEIR
jgi:hypothetical protein